jgi:hypothetical protein
VLIDGGFEVHDAGVDHVVNSNRLTPVVVQTEMRVSSSMVESWWECRKRQWLYLYELDFAAMGVKISAFEIEQYNAGFPPAAFVGLTTDEA